MKESLVYDSNKKALMATIALIVIIFSATYAYFTVGPNNANAAYNLGIENELNITYLLTAGSNITLTVNPEDLQQGSNSYVETTGGQDAVTLDNASQYSDITCSYEIWYTPTNYFKGTNSSYMEFELIGTDLSGTNSGISFNLTNVTSTTLVKSGIIGTNSSITSASQTWQWTIRHHNLSTINQTNQAGKSYSGKVFFKAKGCANEYAEYPTLSETVVALANGQDRTASDSSIYKIEHETFTATDGTTTIDAGYRYEGKNPNNYVQYNDELWRIIGVFQGSTIGLEPGKMYTQIIRSARLSSYYQWNVFNDLDADNTYDRGETHNDWENATLKITLNTDYLNRSGSFSSQGLNGSARGMIAKYNGNYSTWHIRGAKYGVYETLSSPGYYEYERILGQSGDGGAYAEEVVAPIGLMYPSDYGYAMYGGPNETTCLNDSYALYTYENCEQYDWLYLSNNWQWTIMPQPGVWHPAFIVFDTGNVFGDFNVISAFAVRPVLYLEASVKTTGGTGTSSDPYTIS